MKQAFFILCIVTIFACPIYAQAPILEFEYANHNFGNIKIGQNGSSSSLLVIGGATGNITVYTTDGFKISNGSEYVDTARYDGGSLIPYTVSLTYSFFPTEDKTYYGYLIAADEGTMRDTIVLLGDGDGFIDVSKESGGVPPHILISPNPTQSFVHVSMTGAELVECVEIIDELGKVLDVDRRPIIHNNTWRSSSNSFAMGTYFIRISGTSADGKPFVVIKRFVSE